MSSSKITIATSTLKYNGADRMDITAKYAKPPAIVLAPTWDLVGGVLRHLLEVNGHAAKPWMLKHPAITPAE